jgi:hypothetical protein
VAEDARMIAPLTLAPDDDALVIADLARTEELPSLLALPTEPCLPAAVNARKVADETGGDSDVFLMRRAAPPSEKTLTDADEVPLEAVLAAAEGVTLFVYGWENVQPGPLSWAFPSLRAALLAVRTMRNAVEWCIVSGREASVDAARAKGAVLIEQNA